MYVYCCSDKHKHRHKYKHTIAEAHIRAENRKQIEARALHIIVCVWANWFCQLEKWPNEKQQQQRTHAHSMYKYAYVCMCVFGNIFERTGINTMD